MSNAEEHLWINVMGGCGCGSADELAMKSAVLLREIADKSDPTRCAIYQDECSELIAHWFDSVELTEHGTSIGGSWLTPKGLATLAEMDRLKADERSAENQNRASESSGISPSR